MVRLTVRAMVLARKPPVLQLFCLVGVHHVAQRQSSATCTGSYIPFSPIFIQFTALIDGQKSDNVVRRLKSDGQQLHGAGLAHHVLLTTPGHGAAIASEECISPQYLQVHGFSLV